MVHRCSSRPIRENKKKRKKKETSVELPPAIFLPVMQYSWAGTPSLGEKLSSDRISDQVKSVGERELRDVTIVGLAYARRNFKESSGPITTTFASVACGGLRLIFIDALDRTNT